MSIPYLFICRHQVDKNMIYIKDADDVRHLRSSLRARPGDEVYLSDNDLFKYRTVLKEIGSESAVLEIREKEDLKRILPGITLYQCILKKNAMEFVIQKTTEIGISRIIPVMSSRVIPDIHGNNIRIQRWQKISDEASKQSKRDFKCLIGKPVKIEDIDVSSYGYFLFPHERASRGPADMVGILSRLTEAGEIAYLIGPEGGLTSGEAGLIKKKGALETGLGDNIFRAETAALYTLSVIDFYIKSSK